eukprot:Clim_evm24s7 gene=Clim_evmTU24s7
MLASVLRSSVGVVPRVASRPSTYVQKRTFVSKWLASLSTAQQQMNKQTGTRNFKTVVNPLQGVAASCEPNMSSQNSVYKGVKPEDIAKIMGNKKTRYSFETTGYCVGKKSIIGSETEFIGMERKCAGDDAFFYRETERFLYMGIADGVGGWVDVGVDPALFAFHLMNNCNRLAHLNTSGDPQELMSMAYSTLVKEGHVPAGSSTATIAAIDKTNGVLKCANLGDSGILVLRGDDVVMRTSEQQHIFNVPYQLAVMPESMSPGAIINYPDEADLYEFDLVNDDVVVLATDGIFDNMYDDDVVEALSDAALESSEDMSKELVNRSIIFAQDDRRLSPFAKQARMYGHRMTGGKMDDMTAVISRVKDIKSV